MVAPLVFLALLAIVAGWWNLSGGFSEFFGHETEAAGFFGVFTHAVPLTSLLMALLGIFAAYAIYVKRWVTAASIGKFFGPLYKWALNKYYFDKLYEDIIVKALLVKGLFTGFSLFDSRGVDGVVNGAAEVVVRGGRAVRQAQTCQLQLYGLFIGIGVAVIALCVLIWG
jgi:NADH-quinone oxidoreductase subunit L